MSTQSMTNHCHQESSSLEPIDQYPCLFKSGTLTGLPWSLSIDRGSLRYLAGVPVQAPGGNVNLNGSNGWQLHSLKSSWLDNQLLVEDKSSKISWSLFTWLYKSSNCLSVQVTIFETRFPDIMAIEETLFVGQNHAWIEAKMHLSECHWNQDQTMRMIRRLALQGSSRLQ